MCRGDRPQQCGYEMTRTSDHSDRRLVFDASREMDSLSMQEFLAVGKGRSKSAEEWDHSQHFLKSDHEIQADSHSPMVTTYRGPDGGVFPLHRDDGYLQQLTQSPGVLEVSADEIPIHLFRRTQ